MEYDSDGEAIIARHNLRTRIEARVFSSQYLPNYFNALYNVQRYQFGFGTEIDQKLRPTKIGYLALQKNQLLRLGYCLEISYGLQGWFGTTLLYEDAFNWLTFKVNPVSRNFSFHIESIEIGFLQFLTTYQIMNFSKFSQIFNFNRINELLFFTGRMKILPFMYISAWVQHNFRTGSRVNGDEYPRTLPGEFSGERYVFSNIGLHNVWSFGFDVEVALQF